MLYICYMFRDKKQLTVYHSWFCSFSFPTLSVFIFFLACFIASSQTMTNTRFNTHPWNSRDVCIFHLCALFYWLNCLVLVAPQLTQTTKWNRISFSPHSIKFCMRVWVRVSCDFILKFFVLQLFVVCFLACYCFGIPF